MPAYARIAAASLRLPCPLAAFATPATAADLYEPPYDELRRRTASRRTATPTCPTISSRPYPPPAYAGDDRCVPA